MTPNHLTDDELDLLLVEGELQPSRAAHVDLCIACRRRRDELLQVIAESAGADPDEAARRRARTAAVEAWVLASGQSVRPRYRRLAAAAAAVVVAGSILFAVGSGVNRGAPVDTEAVLEEVDEMLSRDPLAAFVADDVVDIVVPSTEERSAS